MLPLRKPDKTRKCYITGALEFASRAVWKRFVMIAIKSEIMIIIIEEIQIHSGVGRQQQLPGKRDAGSSRSLRRSWTNALQLAGHLFASAAARRRTAGGGRCCCSSILRLPARRTGKFFGRVSLLAPTGAMMCLKLARVEAEAE